MFAYSHKSADAKDSSYDNKNQQRTKKSPLLAIETYRERERQRKINNERKRLNIVLSEYKLKRRITFSASKKKLIHFLYGVHSNAKIHDWKILLAHSLILLCVLLLCVFFIIFAPTLRCGREHNHTHRLASSNQNNVNNDGNNNYNRRIYTANICLHRMYTLACI